MQRKILYSERILKAWVMLPQYRGCYSAFFFFFFSEEKLRFLTSSSSHEDFVGEPKMWIAQSTYRQHSNHPLIN